jgi:urea transport system permease protein
VPIAGIISPTNVDAAASIMLLAGVALGGRASLLGPAVGAIAVGYGRSTLSERFPTTWTYFRGALFILVMLFLPGGIASLWPKVKSLGSRVRSPRTRAAVGHDPEQVPATATATAPAMATSSTTAEATA